LIAMTDPPTLYLDAALRPHRSMSCKGLWTVLAVMGAYNALVALFMWSIGAFPVPIFLGIDVLGVAIAFRVSSRRAARGERVLVTHDEVKVLKETGIASLLLWRSPTAFTRVEVDASDDGASSLRVRLSGRSLAIGGMLGPMERAGLAERLQSAIAAALAERHG